MSSVMESTRILPEWLQKVNFFVILKNIFSCSFIFMFIVVSQYLPKNPKDCYVSIERLNIEDETASTTQDTIDKENNIATNLNIRKNDSLIDPPPAKRYMTRRSAALSANNGTSLSNNAQRTKKRAHTSAQPRKPPAFIEYKGKVEYCTHFVDIAVAADTLL